MITSREYTAVPVATGDAAPSSGNCHGGGVSLNSGVSVLDVLNFHPECYSKNSGSTTLDILADVYLMDNEGNRPFNKLSIQCNIPTAVTFADLTFGVTDDAVDGGTEEATAVSDSVQAICNTIMSMLQTVLFRQLMHLVQLYPRLSRLVLMYTSTLTLPCMVVCNSPTRRVPLMALL